MRMLQEKVTSPDESTNLFLRAVAILAVITLHVLAILPPETYRALEYRPFAVAIDQLCRFCVPLFVALSGYGFWKKYQLKTFTYRTFLFKQSVKLLPLYIFSSLVFYALFQIVPAWRPTWEVPSLPAQILTGQADYHLYFVPMIFQCYLLFPVFLWLMKRASWLTLTTAALWQVGVYMLMSSTTPGALMSEYFATDLAQYFWFFSWVFYFILGMSLEPILQYMKHLRWPAVVVIGVAAIGWYWAWSQGMNAMAADIDPIIAMRFTRPPIMFYATAMILSLMLVGQWVSQAALTTKPQLSRLLKPLLVLGQHSFAIYLFHTLALRVISLLLK